MLGEYFRLALMIALGALLIAAAITDLRSRIISNRLNLAVALLAPLWWLASGLDPWPGMALQLLAGALVFMVFAALFAIGMMGGGDVKLLGALALWFPWQAMLSLIVLMALLGGLVTLVTLLHHRWAKRPGQPEIPYGVAISIAALWLIGERYLNHFA
ncbi:MAG TPA: peptidase [Sphingobium sp.]|uniref:A24 family peptidase n=1 Tax=unclassified Sphingobium TaxID=2611147 RepID=UPI0007F51770|nr:MULTISPECIES: prepilin peptidase [unclassified Sphingobium]OAN54233.1 peptidase [Sphingobium sp. TCM1]WIW87364.1 prepilin peptidase [Sphingobium sp. V4]HAF42365.1 peptidase [Sphingobium sp.]